MTPTAKELEEHRAALTGHCYRMLGSAVEADDAVQETVVRAWRSLDRFDGRSSLRTWLYRIATNVCLDALADRSRRARPMELGPEGSVDDPLDELPRTHWLEPIPDSKALPADADPSELLILRQSIRLAFVAALQHLPPRQRAALLLAEVLGWSAAEVAETLDTSVPACQPRRQRRRRDALRIAVAPAQPLRRGVPPLRRGCARGAAPRGCRLLDAALRALASRPPARPELAARARRRLSRIAAGADRRLRLAGFRPLQAIRITWRASAMGGGGPRAGRRRDLRLDLVPGRADALPPVRVAFTALLTLRDAFVRRDR